ncbi:hypothetical protein, partial [Pseudomonas lactis]|uniref:hypothetical protein n=1 Tax=Pseudomonas lactis TaxID=1615674 RepID=UPI0019D3B745
TGLQLEKSYPGAGSAKTDGTDGLRGPFIIQISDFRFQISDFRFQKSKMPRQVGAFAFSRRRLRFHTACKCRVFYLPVKF